MAVHGVNPKCYILALFVRDDEERFLLGDGPYEFKDKQLHFQPNTVANDVVEVQGNDGYLLAGQVRRPGVQAFDGYVGMGTTDKATVETQRRAFFQFFRRGHFYKVIYVFPNGTAIQRKQGFLVDDPTVQELYQQYPEYHVALNFEDVNYYTYEEDSEGHEIYAKEAIIKLTGGGAKGGLIWDSVGVVWEDSQWGGEETVDATAVQIDNQLNTRVGIHDTQLKGDTYQQTYSGANLFNYTDTSETIGSGITTDSDGWITCTYNNSAGTSTRYSNYYTKPLALTPSTNYALVLEIRSVSGTGSIEGGGSNATSQVATYRVDFENMTAGSTIVIPIFSRNDVSGANGLRTYFRFNAGQSGSVTVRISVLADTSVTPQTFVYQPYTGGIPAPNPDYPEPINVVTGVQNVWVHGKNLFNPDASFALSGDSNLTKTIIPTGVRMTCGTTNTSSSAYGFGVFVIGKLSNYIGKKVTLTTNATTSTTNKSYVYIGTCNANGGNRSVKSSQNGATGNYNFSISWDVVEDTNQYLCVALYTTQNAAITAGDYVDYKNLQLEIGTATPYEAYVTPQSYTIDLGSTELCKIGNYQDYIYKSGDDWYVHKALKKITFSGDISETWVYNSGSAYPFRYNLADADQLAESQAYAPNVVVNYYTPFAWNISTRPDYGVTAATVDRNLCFRNVDMTSLDAWKTWLASHNTITYYPLATPTDTKITDATLVGQLDALDGMRLYVGENNIQVLPESGTDNLPAIAHFKYYTALSNTGAEWEEGGTSGATIVEVDAIDNTYPVWELVGPSVNPTLTMLTTNTTLVYNGTISSSQKLVIDMFNKTATLNGTSVIGNVSGDWTYMAPGTNRVAYTAGNTDAPDSTIYWQEVVG